jgi:predicted N-acetyltransferase YhbS
VDPAEQRRGLGTMLVQSLLDRLPVWRTMLVAGPDVQAFYARLGFALHSDVMARLNRDRLFDTPRPPRSA